ncbi:unnamed protein product [Meloidogyne enterolobii]|uniref:Uncharacterized protein n=1 Tax=Meloidogyne enterolobii TaxID=390850 RepID=A0ACB0YMF9_MELEN
MILSEGLRSSIKREGEEKEKKKRKKPLVAQSSTSPFPYSPIRQTWNIKITINIICSESGLPPSMIAASYVYNEAIKNWGLSIYGSILDQLFGTALLAAGLWAITDKRNRVPSGFIPLLAGLILTMISLTFGLNGGFAINPARDLGPRLFMLSIGLGWGMFSNNNFYFWIPLAVPFVGALIGAFVYNLLIGVHGLDEQIEISGANYPRENDRGYKEYNSNPASVGVTSHLVSYSSTINR